LEGLLLGIQNEKKCDAFSFRQNNIIIAIIDQQRELSKPFFAMFSPAVMTQHKKKSGGGVGGKSGELSC
jgi:hypothetical protein